MGQNKQQCISLKNVKRNHSRTDTTFFCRLFLMSGSYVWHHCLTASVFLHFHLLLKWMPRYLQSFATLTSPPRIHKDYVDILSLLKTITLSLVLSTFRADDFSQTTPQNHPLLVPCTPPPNPPTLMHPTTKEPSENLLQIAWPWVTLKVWGIKGERGWAQHTVCSVELLYCSLSQSDRALLVRRPTVSGSWQSRGR